MFLIFIYNKETHKQLCAAEFKSRVMSMNYIYILQCADGTLYTGWTNNLEKRVKTHNSGKGCKYTRARTPVQLVYWESFATKQEAQSREFAIKKMNRKAKERLISNAKSRTCALRLP